MIPVIIWAGTQTGANSFKEHLRFFNNETKEYRINHIDEILSELNKSELDVSDLLKRLSIDKWSFKYLFKSVKNYNRLLNKKLIIRLVHGYFDYEELDKIIETSFKYNYQHVFLYRESLFDQALGWFHEDYGIQYENELPLNDMMYAMDNFKKDLFYTYNYIKDKVNLNIISYETLYIRREKDKIISLLDTLGFKNTSDQDIHKFIFNRYKHFEQGPKFKIDEEKGPISESIKHSYKKNFDILYDIYCDEKIKL